MRFPYVPSYVISFGYCIQNNLFTPRFCIAVILTILLLSMLWFMYQKCIKIKYTTRRENINAFKDLHKATFENDVITTFRMVQKYPAAINIPHPADGYTPFMRACLNGNTQLVRLMLNYGADITHRTTKGETPFYLAVFHLIQNPRNKDASCIHTLYYAGADINAANDSGYSPLHLAAIFGHTQLTQWLLNKGVKRALHPDPSMLARYQGHYETAKCLEQRRLPAIE